MRADDSIYAASFQVGAADVAEWVDISEPLTPGTVVELDPADPLAYRASQTSCSLLVAGVVSAIPGVELGDGDPSSPSCRLALAGIVPTRVTDEGGSIRPGDLLVTSSTPGHAMRWSGPDQCPCALVGKALEPMDGDNGSILVLLTAH